MPAPSAIRNRVISRDSRADALVSLGVILSALAVALGAPVADPIVGLRIAALILRITWQSWRTVSGHVH